MPPWKARQRHTTSPINSQAGHFDYAYEEPGTYVARATVSTVAGDSQSATVTVQISGP
ncbi:MAG: hypothetical protein OXI50_04330 [Gammaproteobacteria bacterium]|nr:hypothetical protein [Gammaproteobacteria bacterium]